MAKTWKDTKSNLICLEEACKKAILAGDGASVAEHLAQFKIISELIAKTQKLAEEFIKENKITHTDEYGHYVGFIPKKGSRRFNQSKALSDLIELGKEENDYFTVGEPTVAIKVTLNKGNILK